LEMSENQSAQPENPSFSGKPTPKTGLKRFAPAIRHSISGLKSTVKTESAFRQEICGFMLLAPVAVWLGESSIERVLLIAPLFIVLIVELLNSALESAVDRWGNEYNDFTKAAKDAGSAAVFLSLLLVVFVWVMLLLIPLF
jgi:diacylglycerol kinase (ATP)